jgi:hypothetical protein
MPEGEPHCADGARGSTSGICIRCSPDFPSISAAIRDHVAGVLQPARLEIR